MHNLSRPPTFVKLDGRRPRFHHPHYQGNGRTRRREPKIHIGAARVAPEKLVRTSLPRRQ